MWLENHLDIFFGRSTDVVTDVYARVPRETPWSGPLRLAGQITGPLCSQTRTLPATVSFVDLGDGPTLLARARVPDLAAWSPLHPHLYRIHIELLQKDAVVDQATRLWGCHRLGVDKCKIVVGTRRVPLVAVRRTQPQLDAQRWRQLNVAALVESPNDAWLQEASQWGTITVCLDAAPPPDVIASIRMYARYPCAWLAVCRGGLPQYEEWRVAAPNLLIASCWHGVPTPNDAPIVVVDECEYDRFAEHLDSRAVVVVRQRHPLGLPDEEAAAQVLQWAEEDNFRKAGYVMW